jgi:eukaryotic-like serine/threonine-protein kinase
MGNRGKELYEFGPFQLDPEKRVLLRDHEPVPLQLKAFETLLVLVRNSEQVVLKDDLMKTVWPDTFVEESNLAQNIFVLRKTLGETAGDPHYIVTIPGRGYRFREKVRIVSTEEVLLVESHSRSRMVIDEQILPGRARSRIQNADLSVPAFPRPRRWGRAYVATAAILALVAGGYWYTHRRAKLTSKDTIVLADFANNTGDRVFDGTLLQGLSIALRQSPFLNILSEGKVSATLRQMTRPSNSPVTPEVAREICQRTNSRAYVAGSINTLGSTYVVGLKAVDCRDGEIMAEEQATAPSKEKVLDTLGRAASNLRGEMGESLGSVKKFDVPLEQATTSSLEALEAYTQCQRSGSRVDLNSALQQCSRAVELDPNFARAYAALGTDYGNLNQSARAIENYKKAYALRERTTDRERYYIEGVYYSNVTGEANKAIQVYRDWIQSYPQDVAPHFNLSSKYGALGNFQNASAEMEEALRLDPSDAGGYGVLMGFYLALNRWDDAKKLSDQASAQKLSGFVLREKRYDLAFLNNDAAGMQQQLQGRVGNGTEEYQMLSTQADTAAFGGKLAVSRDFMEGAIEGAIHNDARETAAVWRAIAGMREAETGNPTEARKDGLAALATSSGKTVQLRAVLALARAGDAQDTQKLIDDLDRDYPLDTVVQMFYLPAARASVLLSANKAAEALKMLEPAEAFELGGNRTMYPAYIRGQAYLMSKQGKEAAAEFQKLLDHRGIMCNFILGALAHLQLARAQTLMGDVASARKSYQDFFALWADADPDVPILKQARAEYAKLQ